MSDRDTATRRSVLEATGAALAAAVVPATASAAQGWTSVESPTGNTLYDVEYTTTGARAVGAGGVVERAPRGWRTVLDGGPTGNGNSLYGADLTDDPAVAVGAGGTVIER